MVLPRGRDKENIRVGQRNTRLRAKAGTVSASSRRRPLVDHNGSPTKLVSEHSKPTKPSVPIDIEALSLSVEKNMGILANSPNKKSSDFSSTNMEVLNKRMFENISYALEHMNQARALGPKEFPGSRYDCSKYFNILYKIRMVPDTTILSLHVKYALQILEILKEKFAFHELTNIYNHLPIYRKPIEPYDVSPMLVVESLEEPSILISRIVTSLQLMILKIFAEKYSTCAIIAADSVILDSLSQNCVGGVYYWSQFLPVNERDSRLSTISKIAYSLAANSHNITTELLVASIRIHPFPASCKLLTNVLSQMATPHQFIINFKEEIVQTMANIMDSSDGPLDSSLLSLLDLFHRFCQGTSYASLIDLAKFRNIEAPKNDYKQWGCDEKENGRIMPSRFRRQIFTYFKTCLNVGKLSDKEFLLIINTASNSPVRSYELCIAFCELLKTTRTPASSSIMNISNMFIEGFCQRGHHKSLYALPLSSAIAYSATRTTSNEDYCLVMAQAVELDRYLFRANTSALAPSTLSEMSSRVEALLGKSIQLGKNVTPYIVFGFHLIDKVQKLANMGRTRALESVLDNNKRLDRLVCLTAQSAIQVQSFTIVDLQMSDLNEEVVVFISELVLSVLWRTRSSMKEQVSQDLITCIFNTLPFASHPIRCARAVCYFYNANSGKFPTIDATTEDALLGLLKGDLAEDIGLIETRPMMMALMEIILCLSDKSPDTFTKYSPVVEKVVHHLKEYSGPSKMALPPLVLKQIDMFLSILASSACYNMQATLLEVIVGAGNSNIKHILDLAEARLNLGQSSKATAALDLCHGYFTGYRNHADDNKALLLARFLLLRADACIMDCDAKGARQYLGELANFTATVQESQLACSVETIKTFQGSLTDLHEKVSVFSHGMLTHLEYAMATQRIEEAAKIGNGLTKFVTAYLKKIQDKKGLVDIRPVISCAIRASAASARVYARMGVFSACDFRLKYIRRMSQDQDEIWKLLQYRWSSSLDVETLVRSNNRRGASQFVHEMRLFYGIDDKISTDDMLGLEKAYAYMLTDVQNAPISQMDYSSCIHREMFGDTTEEGNLIKAFEKLDISSQPEYGLIRAQARNAVVYSVYQEQNLNSHEESIRWAQKCFDKFANPLLCPEYLLVELAAVRIIYKKALQKLNSNPLYTGIDTDIVLAIPSVNRPLTRSLEAKKLLLEASQKIEILKPHVLSRCNIGVINDFVLLNGDIDFLCNAVGRHVNADSAFYLREVPRDMPYSIRSGKGLTYHDIDLAWPREEELAGRVKHSGINSVQIMEAFDTAVIPVDWVVVSLSYQEKSESLVVTRYTTFGEPFSIRLPKNIHRDSDYDDEAISLPQAVAQIKKIVNDANIKVDKPADQVTEQEKVDWWSAKYDGEAKLHHLMELTAYKWFGGFRAMFGSPLLDISDSFVDSFNCILAKYLPSRQKKKGSARTRINHVELDRHIYRLFALASTVCGLPKIKAPGDPPSTEKHEDDMLIEDMVRFLLDILIFQGEQNPYDELDVDQMCVDIEELLRTIPACRPAKQTVLVVDKICHEFPWESLPFLINKEVSRVPSLGILHRMLTINPSSQWKVDQAFYVLDPGRDLASTRDRMSKEISRLTRASKRRNWDGVVGISPTEDELTGKIQDNCDLYIYIGHGGGREYMTRASVEGMGSCPPAMLFGCRSLDLENEGDFESTGNQLSYLSAGCPMLLCTLFTVTDRDTDHHTTRILNEWLGYTRRPGSTITETMVESRKEMKLPYLNGAAFVVYGLPLAVK